MSPSALKAQGRAVSEASEERGGAKAVVAGEAPRRKASGARGEEEGPDEDEEEEREGAKGEEGAAPRSVSRYLTMCRWPRRQARCSGVFLFRSRALGSAKRCWNGAETKRE